MCVSIHGQYHRYDVKHIEVIAAMKLLSTKIDQKKFVDLQFITWSVQQYRTALNG